METASFDPVAARTVVTNLRLPGQYDERLLASVGLQGPYYNWNRWYLPSVGRYLELDPIAKAGGVNGTYGPDWYGYAAANPLRNTDFHGLERDLPCKIATDDPWLRKVCEKGIQWACKWGLMGAEVCCRADDEECTRRAGDDAVKQAECVAKLALCKAGGGKKDAKPPENPSPPGCN